MTSERNEILPLQLPNILFIFPFENCGNSMLLVLRTFLCSNENKEK
jgi:hypothetical protein